MCVCEVDRLHFTLKKRGHRKGWWSSWLEVGLRKKRESRVRTPHEREWGGTKKRGHLCTVRCGAVRSVGAGRARRGRGAGTGLFGAAAIDACVVDGWPRRLPTVSPGFNGIAKA